MDVGRAYYSDPSVDAFGLVSNILTPVDDMFFKSLDWGNLEAETMVATSRA